MSIHDLVPVAFTNHGGGMRTSHGDLLSGTLAKLAQDAVIK